MKEWKSIATDGYPEIGKPLWYFFEYVGVHFGQYYGGEEIKIYNTKTGKYHDYGYEVHTFGGEKGFLGDDVTHWMYFEDGDEKPEKPNGY